MDPSGYLLREFDTLQSRREQYQLSTYIPEGEIAREIVQSTYLRWMVEVIEDHDDHCVCLRPDFDFSEHPLYYFGSDSYRHDPNQEICIECFVSNRQVGECLGSYFHKGRTSDGTSVV